MTPVTTGAAVFTFVASIVTGWIFVDDRFAHSADTSRQFNQMQEQFVQQDIRQIERDIFALRQEAERRQLSGFERERLRQLQNDKSNLERKLRGQ